MTESTKTSLTQKNQKNPKTMRKLGGKILWRYPSLWINPIGEKGEVTFGNVFRAMTGNLRVLPDFLIIGTQKGGTYSLYNNIMEHPFAYSVHTKEIRFFDRYFYRGESWYRANFPTKFSKFISKMKGHGFITGEATHDYIFHNVVPIRVKKLLPNVKIIVTLRNPIDRAYSQYNMRKRSGEENLSFEDAIKIHDERIQKSWWHQQRFSYLKRGLYAEQLQHWFNYFPQEQFYILETGEMEKNPSKIFNQLYDFLGIKKFEIDFKKHNVAKYNEMNQDTRNELIEYFKPYNKKLYKLIGRKFDWEN